MNALPIIAGLCLPVLLLTGAPDIPDTTAPADLIMPAPGTPLSAEQTEKRTRNLPNGTTTDEVIKSKVYRDSAGRLRIETDVKSASHHPANVLLLDPTTGYKVILMTQRRVALRIAGPKSGDSGFALGFGGIGEGLPEGNWNTRTETLGKRVIEGVEFEGTRITQTSQARPSLTAVVERWYSKNLRLTALAVASGPSGTHTAKLQNLVYGEPDHSLFSIPQEYKIQEVELGGPPK